MIEEEEKSKKRSRVHSCAQHMVFFFFPFFTRISRSIFNTRRKNDVLSQLDVVACSGWSCCKRVSIKRSGSLTRIDNQQGVEVISR